MSGRTSGPFVGRAGDLAWLRSRLADAVDGHGGSVLIAGEAGVGKSRLVGELLGDLDPDVLVLSGNCLDLQIADCLVISRSTAGVYLSHIRTKIGVSDRAAAATWAQEHGLIARTGQ